MVVVGERCLAARTTAAGTNAGAQRRRRAFGHQLGIDLHGRHLHGAGFLQVFGAVATGGHAFPAAEQRQTRAGDVHLALLKARHPKARLARLRHLNALGQLVQDLRVWYFGQLARFGRLGQAKRHGGATDHEAGQGH